MPPCPRVSMSGRKARHSSVNAVTLSSVSAVWLLVGSLAIKLADDTRLANRSYLLDGSGEIVAWYDKVHMFDVNLANGRTFKESETYRPGDRAVVADTPWGPLGMTVCYDIRFPYLYRRLAHAGARMLAVPSAFNRRTGDAHWHVLMRSRAIETGCYIIAPAQCGDHDDGRVVGPAEHRRPREVGVDTGGVGRLHLVWPDQHALLEVARDTRDALAEQGFVVVQ